MNSTKTLDQVVFGQGLTCCIKFPGAELPAMPFIPAPIIPVKGQYLVPVNLVTHGKLMLFWHHVKLGSTMFTVTYGNVSL